MTNQSIARLRLRNQRLAGTPFDTPEDVVGWLTAVQAQDYGGAKWGIAQRSRSTTNATLDQLFDDGAILRTHVLRPTWHLVLPADIRWLLALTSPRVHAANAHYYRRHELDDALFQRSDALIVAALQHGRQLTRAELARVLLDAGISASGPRLAYLLMHAELDGLICSGALRGRQHTYALLDERVPPSAPMDRDAALAELAQRYVASHGPATVHDFSWWSGLRVSDARTGVELAHGSIEPTTVDGTTYWSADPAAEAVETSGGAHLLPNYDEYLVAYSDYGVVFDPALRDVPNADAALQGHIIVLDGMVAGGWRRTARAREVIVETRPLRALDARQRADLQSAAQAYGRFMELPVTMHRSAAT
jgi:hypothetical protein